VISRRISVAGDSGSGKTTVSRAIAARLDLPHIELDGLFHGPNWSTPPKEEFRCRVAETLGGLDGWVADGNYTGSLGSLVLERAELLIWLDLPLRVCLLRIWHRTWRRIRTREELWASKNRETLRGTFFSRDSLFLWTLKAHFRHRRDWPARFAAQPHLEVVRLRTQRDVDRWVAPLAVRHSPSQ
jgi:adenylate kinase family enzyme